MKFCHLVSFTHMLFDGRLCLHVILTLGDTKMYVTLQSQFCFFRSKLSFRTWYDFDLNEAIDVYYLNAEKFCRRRKSFEDQNLRQIAKLKCPVNKVFSNVSPKFCVLNKVALRSWARYWETSPIVQKVGVLYWLGILTTVESCLVTPPSDTFLFDIDDKWLRYFRESSFWILGIHRKWKLTELYCVRDL